MYRLLLPLDTEEGASRRITETVAAFPGDRGDYEIVVLHVFEDIEVGDAEGPRVTNEDVYDTDRVPESVQTAVDRLESDGFTVDVDLQVGEPREVILSVADERDVDQIVVGGRRRSPVGKVLFGSVTQGVLLNSDVPVTAVMTGE